MLKRILGALFVLLLALSFSSLTFAQDTTKPEMSKESMMKSGKMPGMTKEEKAMGPLKSVTCDPSCGFMVRSHSEKEIISMVKEHAKNVHHKKMTDAQVKEMIKTEDEAKQ